MGRPLRREYAGACYHVINRGRSRQIIFARRDSARTFIETLGETARRFHWRVHAYVVMLNHFHLAVETPEANLGAGMHWLQVTWARRWQELGRATSRPFQDRYKALLVEPSRSLADVANFIHLNPARARVVPAHRLANYPWSSLPRFIAKARPTWLAPEVILRETGPWMDSPAGWTQYQRHLIKLTSDDASRHSLSAARLSRKPVIGSAAFIEAMRRNPPELAKSLVLPATEKTWQQQLTRLAKLADINLRALPAAKTAPPKALLAAAMKATTATPNAWLARVLHAGQPATVSQIARRARLNPALAATLKVLLQRAGLHPPLPTGG